MPRNKSHSPDKTKVPGYVVKVTQGSIAIDTTNTRVSIATDTTNTLMGEYNLNEHFFLMIWEALQGFPVSSQMGKRQRVKILEIYKLGANLCFLPLSSCVNLDTVI